MWMDPIQRWWSMFNPMPGLSMSLWNGWRTSFYFPHESQNSTWTITYFNIKIFEGFNIFLNGENWIVLCFMKVKIPFKILHFQYLDTWIFTYLNIKIFGCLNIFLNGEHLIQVLIPSLFEPSSVLGSQIERKVNLLQYWSFRQRDIAICMQYCNIDDFTICVSLATCCNDHIANESSFWGRPKTSCPKYSHSSISPIFVNPTCFTSVPRGWFVSRRPLGDQPVLPIQQPLPLAANTVF